VGGGELSERRDQPILPGEQQLARRAELQREPGVEHVR
jgi:hypothetical protein